MGIKARDTVRCVKTDRDELLTVDREYVVAVVVDRWEDFYGKHEGGGLILEPFYTIIGNGERMIQYPYVWDLDRFERVDR